MKKPEKKLVKLLIRLKRRRSTVRSNELLTTALSLLAVGSKLLWVQ
jgi:hypothetical protein